MKKSADRAGSGKDSHYARLRRRHREAKAAAAIGAADAAAETVHLYGLHTVSAAIGNPNRDVVRMLVTANALNRLEIKASQKLPFPVEVVAPQIIDKVLPADAVHQGVVIEAKPLTARPLELLGDANLVLVLDQVTDPHNVGAIMRSAVSFGAGALVTTRRHSPQESGVLAKSASGALEIIPHIQVTNLAAAIETLNGIGFLTIGLDSEGPDRLENTFGGTRIALVLGAEGKGLRQKTRATVRKLARLDMPGAIKSLNVSNAAAIALYAAHRYLTVR